MMRSASSQNSHPINNSKLPGLLDFTFTVGFRQQP